MLIKNLKKTISTRDPQEKTKIHLGGCKRAFIIFAMQVKFQFLKGELTDFFDRFFIPNWRIFCRTK